MRRETCQDKGTAGGDIADGEGKERQAQQMVDAGRGRQCRERGSQEDTADDGDEQQETQEQGMREVTGAPEREIRRVSWWKGEGKTNERLTEMNT